MNEEKLREYLKGLTPEQRAELVRGYRMELAPHDLIEFSCAIDPDQDANYRAQHLRNLATHLEAVERGEIKRLFVTMPPRHYKSSLSSEKFPMWYLGRNPKKEIIAVSHSAALVQVFSQNVRDTLAINPVVKHIFPHVGIGSGSARVSDWSLNGAYRSSYRAIGVGGGIAGTGADLILCDDPIGDHQSAFSKGQREELWHWYTETLRERLNPGGAIVLIMSRWHEDDIAGRLIMASKTGDGEPYKVLHLPALSDGKALWPEKFPVEELEKIRKGIGGRAFAAKYMGTPKPDDGKVLDSSKLVRVDRDKLPEFKAMVRHWDLAFSEAQGADYVCGCLMGLAKNDDRYILDLKRIQGRWPQSKPIIIQTSQDDGPKVKVSIECNGTQLGYYQDIKADAKMMNRTVLKYKPEGNKEVRASMWGSRLGDGIVHCVRAAWNQAFWDECDFFPNGEHDDQVDAVSGSWQQLTAGRIVFVG